MKKNKIKNDAERIKVLIGRIDNLYDSIKGVTKKAFLNDSEMQKLVVHKFQKIGTIGQRFPSHLKRYPFFWNVFYFLESWEEEGDVTWDLLKGCTHKGVYYESLADHNEELKLILEAVLLEKPDLSPKERIKVVKQRRMVKKQQSAQDKNIGNVANNKRRNVNVLYTPMGNKR